MTEILGKVFPLLFLIGLGFVLQRKKYFSDEAFDRLQSMVLNIALPCMLCTTFINLEIDSAYLWVSVAFFVLLVLQLLVGFAVCRIFSFHRRFLPFLMTSFGFGTTAIPFYSALYGQQNLKYLSVLGVGHELFIALVFLPLAQVLLEGKKLTPKGMTRALRSPFLLMTFLGLGIRLLNLQDLLFQSALGLGFYGAIERLGALSLTLTLIIIGYRLKLSDKARLLESMGYTVVRWVLTLSTGFLFKWLVLDRLVAPNPLFDAAYIILLFQHSSISLTVMVGKSSTREEHEVAVNTFVLNAVGGILFFVLYALLV